MEKLQLGPSGPEVSCLCLGTDLFGTKRDKATSYRLLDVFREHGGTFVDTANFYASWMPGFSGGNSETVIGQWLLDRGARDQMVISSKLGFDYPGSPGGLTASEIERECEKSLRRLHTDRLDMYWAHRDDRETPLEETLEAFDRLIQSGKVRAIGASNVRTWRVAQSLTVSRTNGWHSYTAVQQRYTYLHPMPAADFGPQIFIADELKDLASTTGIALVAYSVLLSGAYEKGVDALPPQFAGADTASRLEALHEVSREAGATVNQVIIAWMRQSTPAILPIIAGSSPEQLTENIQALRLRLSPELMDRLDTAGVVAGKQGWLQPT